MIVTLGTLMCCGSPKNGPGNEPPGAADEARPDASINELSFTAGSTIVVDGSIDADWGDAKRVEFVYRGSTIEVRYKHDGSKLLFAFTGMRKAGFAFPEVSIDVRGDRACSWQPDDWWFHASAKDCWATGGRNEWDSCVELAPNWEANNNNGASVADPVEIAIPFTTLGLDSQSSVFGVAFTATDTQASSALWPGTADPDKPCTWAKATLN